MGYTLEGFHRCPIKKHKIPCFPGGSKSASYLDVSAANFNSLGLYYGQSRIGCLSGGSFCQCFGSWIASDNPFPGRKKPGLNRGRFSCLGDVGHSKKQKQGSCV